MQLQIATCGLNIADAVPSLTVITIVSFLEKTTPDHDITPLAESTLRPDGPCVKVKVIISPELASVAFMVKKSV